MKTSVSLRITPAMMEDLQQHLFPGDHDEHGAVIAASVVSTERGTRLLAHRLFLARDGIDYVEGQRGYRMLTSTFVMDCALECADLGMAHLAVHCHGGDDHVGFSDDDMASHNRGYPALVDILDGPPVGGLVFARNAVAGDIWFADGTRQQLDVLVVPDRPIRHLTDVPPIPPQGADERYERQARLFGDRGQAHLKSLKVGVIGAGGAGSLIDEYLSRLGVGEIVAIDPELIEESNLSRVVGSRDSDLGQNGPRWLPPVIRRMFARAATAKVEIAERVALEAQPAINFTAITEDITRDHAAQSLVDCDYLFLAADSMQARLVFNALVHQYLIPGVQMGAKVQIDQDTGDVIDLFAVIRPLVPGRGCLWCNGLIPSAKLQEEATSPEQRRRQRYVDEDEVHAPSVITLNALAAGHSTNDFLMTMVGLLNAQPLTWIKIYPREEESVVEETPRVSQCRECSSNGRLGRGPNQRLPTKVS